MDLKIVELRQCGHWQEGSDIYAYLSLGEMIEMIDSISDEQISLVIEYSDSVEHKEYSRLIKGMTNVKIKDTKQMMIIIDNYISI